MHHYLNLSQVADLLAVWGYLGIFVCVFIGNLGVPIPEETVILAAGFLAGRQILDLGVVYLVVFISAVIGDSCGYLVGRTGGQRLFERLGRYFDFVRQRYERLKVFFEVHGAKAVFMARFITGARFMAGPMAGAAGMRFWRFLGWNVLGALVWCSLMVTIGYVVGDEIEHIAYLFNRAGRWMVLGVIAIVAALVLFWWRDYQQQRSKA